MKLREKNGTGELTMTPIPGSDEHAAVYADGAAIYGGTCRRARPGQNLAGLQVIAVDEESGTFEHVDTGAGKLAAGNSGPTQVATERYRESWERTFGSRGGIS